MSTLGGAGAPAPDITVGGLCAVRRPGLMTKETRTVGLPADELATKLVDLTRISLARLRTMRDPLLDDAMWSVVARVPASDSDDIQEPGQARPE